MTSKLEGLEDADVGSISWIVCWTLKDSGEDGWQPFESYSQAKAFYDEDAANGEVYTQSLTAVMESTDYDVHPAFHLKKAKPQLSKDSE